MGKGTWGFSTLLMPSLGLGCKFFLSSSISSSFSPPPLSLHWDNMYADVGRILFAVVYWYIWTVFLPRWGGYSLEEEVEVLDDGTSITKLVRAYKI